MTKILLIHSIHWIANCVRKSGASFPADSNFTLCSLTNRKQPISRRDTCFSSEMLHTPSENNFSELACRNPQLDRLYKFSRRIGKVVECAYALFKAWSECAQPRFGCGSAWCLTLWCSLLAPWPTRTHFSASAAHSPLPFGRLLPSRTLRAFRSANTDISKVNSGKIKPTGRIENLQRNIPILLAVKGFRMKVWG